MSFDHHWAFTFGVLGNIISFLVFLAPLSTFYRVWKKKSTEGFHSLPYLVALFSAMLWLYYAMLKKDAMLLITINSFGCVIEIIYISIFLTYAPKEARKLSLKLLGFMNLGMIALIFVVVQFAVKSEYRVQVLGWICVAISVSVFAAPLSIVAQVIRTKSVEFLPFSLSLFLTLSAVMWFAYGLFLKDICIAVPNVLGFVLGLLQMLLYAIYRGNNCDKNLNTKEKEKLPEHVKNIVALNTIMPSCDQVEVVVDPKSKDIENQVVDEKVVETNCKKTEDPTKTKSMELTPVEVEVEVEVEVAV